MTVVIINATTATLIPAKALCTIAISAKFWRKEAIINIKSTILLIILMFAISKFKKHPIVYIVSAAIIGMLFKF